MPLSRGRNKRNANDLDKRRRKERQRKNEMRKYDLATRLRRLQRATPGAYGGYPYD